MRLGLLSTARINEPIIAAAAERDDVHIVAVASRDDARAREYGSQHGIPRAYGSYNSLIEDPDVDAVYVSLPNALHHDWTMRALASGKHVLCEKPYSRHPSQVDQAFDAAQNVGLVLMEAFMYRHHPQTATIERRVREGSIGRVLAVRSTFTFPLAMMTDIRAQPELDGGALMDVGCYCVSNSRLLAGEPVSVLAEQVTGTTGVDMALHGTMRFPESVIAQFESSFVAPQRQSLEIVGEEGVLVATAPFRTDWPGEVRISRGDQHEIIAVPDADAYGLELQNFADAVEGRAVPLLGRADALGQARTIDALYRAADTGTSVEL